MKVRFFIPIVALVCFYACKSPTMVLPDSKPCDLSSSTPTSTEIYDFNSNTALCDAQRGLWASHSADISIVEGKGQLTANSQNVSNALEAWKLYKNQMPYNRSWEFSIEVEVPVYWNSNGGKKAQVGIGPFAGKPVDSGESSKVYECNMAAINGDARFVQAQLIKNRLGGNPDDVQFKELPQSKDKATLKIQYCVTHHSLSFFIDGEQVGKSKAIDKDGADNWGLQADGKIDVGIMGFAENTVITSNSPTLDNLVVTIY